MKILRFSFIFFGVLLSFLSFMFLVLWTFGIYRVELSDIQQGIVAALVLVGSFWALLGCTKRGFEAYWSYQLKVGVAVVGIFAILSLWPFSQMRWLQIGLAMLVTSSLGADMIQVFRCALWVERTPRLDNTRRAFLASRPYYL